MTSPDTNTQVVLTADVSQYQQGMGQAQSSTDGLINRLAKLNQATDNMFRNAGRKLEIISAGSIAGITAATASLAAFDAQLRTVRATASLTGGTDVPKLAHSIQQISASTGASTANITALVNTIQGLGVRSASQIASLTRTFHDLQSATGESGTTLANNLMQLTQSMGNNLDPNQMKAYASATANVAANLGTSATAVTNFAQAVQPLGKLLGITETQLIGISGAFAKAGADGGPAFNAFNQMATLLINDLQTGNPQIKQFSDLLGMTQANFAKMAKDNPAKAIADIFADLGQKGPKGIQFLQSVGIEGVRSVNAIQRVAQGGGIAQALGYAQAGAADPGKLTKAAGSAMNDLGAQISRVGTSIQALVSGPFEALESALTHIVRYIADVVDAFVKFGNLPVIHQILQVAGAFASFVSPLVGMAGALITLIPLMAKFGLAWGAIFSRTSVSMLSGMKDSLSGIRREVALAGGAAAMPASAAARAMAASNAGTGPRVGMFQRGMYTVGSMAGGGLYRVLPHEAAGPGGFAPVDVGGLRQFGLNALGGGVRGAGWAMRQMYLNPLERGTQGLQSFLRGPLDGPRQPWNMTWAAQHAYTGGNYALGSPDFWDRQRASGAALLGRIPLLGRPFAVMTSGMPGTGGVPVGPVGPANAAGPMAGSPLVTPAFTRATRSAEQMGEAFRTTTARVTASAAATVRDTEATTEQSQSSQRAAVSLGMLAREATAATVGIAARGAANIAGAGATGLGIAARGGAGLLAGAGTGLMGALGGPWGLGITAAMIGGPMLINSMQHGQRDLTDTQRETQAGTFLGNLNSMNNALGEATVSLKDLAAAADKSSKSEGPAAAWSKSELNQARDTAFKVAGYSAKDNASTNQKLAQLTLTELGKISQGGPLSSDAQRQFRMQLEHMLPDTAQARKIYTDLAGATSGFKQVPQNLNVAANTFKTLGGQYARSIFAHPEEQAGGGAQERARDEVITGLEAIGLKRGGTLAERQAQGAQYTAGLVSAASSISGAGKTANKFFFRDLAKSLGLGAGFGDDVDNLQDFANKMFTSKNANTRTTARTLFGPQGSLDLTSPGAALPQLQQRYNVAQGQIAGQTAQQQAQGYQTYHLGMLGVAPGSLAAGAAANVLGGSQKPEDMTRAVYGVAEALSKSGKSAAESQEAVSKWLATVSTANGVAGPYAEQVMQIADAYNNMQRSTMSLPGQMRDISAQMSKVDITTAQGQKEYANLYTQRQGMQQQVYQTAQQYLLARHQLNIQLERGQEQYQLQVDRSTKQFNLQQERSQQDHDKQVQRTQEAFQRQMARSQADFNLQTAQAQEDFDKQRAHARRDFLYQEGQYVKSVAQSLDPWSQVQAQSVTDSGQLLANLQQQGEMYRTAGSELDKLRKAGLSQNAIDVLGLSDPKNMQQLDRTYKDIASDPKLIKTFNDSIKGRLDWTKGLATDQSSTQWRDMKHQFDTAASDAEDAFDTSMDRSEKAFKTTMARAHQDYKTATDQNADDFETATQRSVQDFNTQMTNMATDYKTSIKHALEDVNDFATEAYGTANQIMKRAMQTADGNMKRFFADAEAQFKAVADAVHSANDNTGGAGGMGSGALSNPFTGNKGKVFEALSSAGFSGTSIAGIMGNIQQESNFNPTASDGTAYGIVQWQGNRLANLQRYANAHHKPISDLQTQINFMVSELTHGGWQSRLNRLPSAAIAANLVNAKYEVSADTSNARPAAATGFAAQIARANRLVPPHAYGGMAFEGDQTLWRQGGFNYPVGKGLKGWATPKHGVESTNTRAAERAVEKQFPGVQSHADASRADQFDHPWGKALDNMIPNYQSKSGVSLGWKVANWFADNSRRFGVKYILWKNWQNDGSGFEWDNDAGLRAQHQNHVHVSFYDQGGVLPPGTTVARNLTGRNEFILTNDQMHALMSGSGSRFASSVPATVTNTHIDSSTNFTGEITVQAQDPNAMADALKNKARMQALTQPDLTTGAPA